MKTLFDFASEAFPEYVDREDKVQEDLYGRRLAEFVADGLKGAGYTVSAVYAEDWGWAVELANDDFPLWVGCANYPEAPGRFVCFIEPSCLFVQRWFHKIPTKGIVEPLADALERILQPVASDLERREP